jgi:hypothetical protein
MTSADLFARVDERGDGCWWWTGRLHESGYGLYDPSKGGPRRVHRYMWEYFNGTVPAGLELHHECRNPQCVNPWHLTPVTHAANKAADRGLVQGKTHCVRGHDKLGELRCRICQRKHAREYAARKREEMAK